jgi:hypothetical protein
VSPTIRVGAFARRCAQAIRSITWAGGSYVVECIEYVHPEPPPEGDPFSDPVEVARMLEQVRLSFLVDPQDATPLTLTMPELIVGILVRRRVRAAIRSATVLGADVQWNEERGLIASWFTVRAVGTTAQLRPLFTLLDQVKANDRAR